MKYPSALSIVLMPHGERPAYLQRCVREFGRTVRFRGLGREVVLFAEPAAIEEVLVLKNKAFRKDRGVRRLGRLLGQGLLTLEPPEHLTERRLIQPAFHRRYIESYASAMVAATQRAVHAWQARGEIDITKATSALTLQIAAETLFGTNVAGRTAAIGYGLDMTLSTWPVRLFPFSELLDRVPVPATRTFDRAKRVLDTEIDGIITAREDAPSGGTDVLSLLLAIRDEDGRPLPRERVRDEAMTILLAGHETTANALAWALYLLDRNPAAARDVRAAIAAAIGKRPPTIEDLPALDAVRAVFAETMRLYPPAWILGRDVVEDVVIDGTALRTGDNVLVSQWVTHRDPDLWPEPERFDPARFAGDPKRHRFAYFPFGGGPRFCIGESFAWLEGVLSLTVILQQLTITVRDDRPARISPLVTLRPRDPLIGTVAAG